MQVEALNHVAVNVSDLSKSKGFYGETLGLKEIDRPKFEFDGAWYRLGNDQELHLLVDPNLAASKNRLNHHFALQVSDVAAAQTELESRGQKLAMGPVKQPDGVTQIFVADPDGYIIEISNP